jgi:flavin reductase (DIM6/NTAB) family NADH-FMN oxidoreductase RutF
MRGNNLARYRYVWPFSDFADKSQWFPALDKRFYQRSMPEDDCELTADSRWPAFIPSPVCVATTRFGTDSAVERSVGATIVNRFPYILALSFCTKHLSDRHYNRSCFTKMIEKSGVIAVQFLSPGTAFDRVLAAIHEFSDNKIVQRIGQSGLAIRDGISNNAPVFEDAYMVYEGRLVKSGMDFENTQIFKNAWADVGSHRLFFFEINTIQLNRNIAAGKRRIKWRSLPAWKPLSEEQGFLSEKTIQPEKESYQKGYTAYYSFPSSKTTAFEYDFIESGMAVKHLPPLPKDQVEVDNDRARWPCFFPSSLSFVTSWAGSEKPNIMPCGSTMVVSRHPMIIAVCIAYATINIRYNSRATLKMIRENQSFGCAVPYIHEKVIDAIQYSGNISFADDEDKVQNSGLEWTAGQLVPILTAMPINFECRLLDEIRLGTHAMFLGEVRNIFVRNDVNKKNPLEWFPVSDIEDTES